MNGSGSFALGIAAAVIPACIDVPEASAGVLYTESNLVAPASHTMFVTLTVDADIHRPPRAMFAWGSAMRPSGPSSRDVEFQDPIDFDRYALIGLDAEGGVLVSFADPTAAIGQEFSSLFPGFNEAEVASAIVSGDALLHDFIRAIEFVPGLSTPLGVECRTVHFSVGADYGSFIADVQPIPAPAGVMVVVMAVSHAAIRRRRSTTI